MYSRRISRIKNVDYKKLYVANENGRFNCRIFRHSNVVFFKYSYFLLYRDCYLIGVLFFQLILKNDNPNF